MSRSQAETLVKNVYPDVKIVDSFDYENLVLVRVERPEADEANYDPFYSVNLRTKTVSEFSVLEDGDPIKLAEAYKNKK